MEYSFSYANDWPNEVYRIIPNGVDIQYRTGIPAHNYFSFLTTEDSAISGTLTDYEFSNAPYYNLNDGYGIDLSASSTFIWNISSYRKLNLGNILNKFEILNNPSDDIFEQHNFGYILIPNTLFLAPLSASKNNSGWVLTTSAVLISSRFLEYDTYNPDISATVYYDSYLNSKPIYKKIPNCNLVYDLSAVKMHSDTPLISFSDNNTPFYANIVLEPNTTKIRPESVHLSYHSQYYNYDTGGAALFELGIQQPPETPHRSFAETYTVLYNPLVNNTHTFQLLQSAINVDKVFMDTTNCILSATLNYNTSLFNYYAATTRLGSTVVALISGKPSTYLGIRYIADSSKIDKTSESVQNTLMSFYVHDSIGALSTPITFSTPGMGDLVSWQTKYPPHYYTYKLSFNDPSLQFNNFTETSNLNFRLTSHPYFASTSAIALSTYLYSNFNLLKLDLQTYGIIDNIQIKPLNTSSTFLSAISCFVGGSIRKYYDLNNPSWIPATSGADIRIEYPDVSLGEYNLTLRTTLSTKVGIMDALNNTELLFAEGSSQKSLGNSIFLDEINQGNNFIDVDCSFLNSEYSEWGRDLTDSYISWFFSPTTTNTKIMSLDVNGDFITFITPNSSVVFDETTWTVRFSGYDDTILLVSLSSQKYTETTSLSTDPVYFDIFSEGFLDINLKEPLSNTNKIRTISLSAGIPYGEKINILPDNYPIFWTWEYDGITDPNSIPLTAKYLNGGDYVFGSVDSSNNLSAINIFVEAGTSNTTPTIHQVKLIVNAIESTSSLSGVYIFEIDDFPSNDIFNFDVSTYYKTFSTVNISNTRDGKHIITRPNQLVNDMIFSINDDVFKNLDSYDIVWNVKSGFGDELTFTATPSITLSLSANTHYTISLSALNCTVAGWVSAHSIENVIRFNNINPLEFYRDLDFKIFPPYTWENSEFLTLLDFSNYTLSLAPTAYSNKNSNSQNFVVSANKQYGTDRYVYDIGRDNTKKYLTTLNKEYGQIGIPYTDEIFSNNGIMVSLTAFNKLFPVENGLYGLILNPTNNVLETKQFNITKNTKNHNIVGGFDLNPKVIPYDDYFVTFNLQNTSLDLNNSKTVTITQTIQSQNTNTPVKVVGGTVSYILSSTYWTVKTDVPATSGTYDLFVLNGGDSFIPLNIDPKELTTLYITASASLETKIPETTFDNYTTVQYNGIRDLWSLKTGTFNQNLTSSNQSLISYISGGQPQIFVSTHHLLTSDNLFIQFDSADNSIFGVSAFDVNFGENETIFRIDTNETLYHSYSSTGTFFLTFTAYGKVAEKYTVESPVVVKPFWEIYDQQMYRLLDETTLTLPYTLEDIQIQPNEFGEVDVFNTSISRLQDNLDYLIGNSKTIDTNSPTYYFGWLGTSTNYKSDGIRWFTDTYGVDEYMLPNNASSEGVSYFTNIDDIEENGDLLHIIDNGIIRTLSSGKIPQEIVFINQSELNELLIQPTAITSNKKGDVIYVTDALKNQILKVDLFVEEFSFLNVPITMGSFGGKDDTNKLNNPIEIIYNDERLFVNDYNNKCIKQYTSDLTWTHTYYVTDFDNLNLIGLAIHPTTNFVYVLGSDNNIYIFEEFADTYFSKIQINDGNYTRMSFDESGDFLYLVGDNIVYKYSAIGVFISQFSIKNTENSIYKSIKSTKNRSLLVSTKNNILKFQDIFNLFKIGDGLDISLWDKSQLILKRENFAQDLEYNNISFLRMVQNIKQFRDNLNSKFVLTSEQTTSGVIQYFSFIPVSNDQKPVFSENIENEKIGVGVNELHIPQVINRELGYIYDALVILKDFLNISDINVETGCNGEFCWSWQALKCYNLSLPTIRICNVNPITFGELTDSFPLSYAPTKKWGEAKSTCCS